MMCARYANPEGSVNPGDATGRAYGESGLALSTMYGFRKEKCVQDCSKCICPYAKPPCLLTLANTSPVRWVCIESFSSIFRN